MDSLRWASGLSGCEIGVLNDGVGREAPEKDSRLLVENLSYASTAIQTAFGVHPTSVAVLDTVPENLPRAASAAYFDRIYAVSQTVKADELTSQEAADALVRQLTRGQLLAVDLDGDSEKTADGVRFLMNAMSDTDLNRQAAEMLSRFDEEAVSAVKAIHTVRRAVSFTFSGMGSSVELTGVLEALSQVQGRGIFFLSGDELRENRAEVKRIAEGGHTLGLSVSNDGTAEEILAELLAGRELLAQMNAAGEIPVQCSLGAPDELLLKAARAGGFPVLSYDLLATQRGDAREADATVVLERITPEKHGAMARGEIVHFRLGFYQNSETLLGELVTLLATRRNIYEIIPATEILEDRENLYIYPLPREEILPAVRDKIHPGQLTDNSFACLSSRYIGAGWVDRSFYLPGFTWAEIQRLDKTGLIQNEENQMFLTFDDWGTDETITGLLDVLKKHGVKATFFIRTNYVKNNPNLVRAIAADGHAIGSHTDQHFKLVNYLEEYDRYEDLTPEQTADLQKDLVTSYETLQSIVGDMQADGQPVLCRIFRSPTLVVSRTGLEAVMDCGFTYVVSGSCSTQDYQAESAAQLYQKLKNNTRSGAVFIMHMSDNSKYTVEALDRYLTDLENSGENYRFCRLSDALDG